MTEGILILLILVLVVSLILQRRKIRDLSRSIEDFLETGKKTPISTNDSALGHLQTDIYELQERMVQQQEVTHQESKANAAFLGDISHQLKTPLAGLRLYCEMDDSPHREKELTLISRMETLIQNVLILEKIRSDTYPMNFEFCDLQKLIGVVLADLRPLFPDKQLTLSGSAFLRVDAQWFTEAVGNVIKNACEHTAADGSVQITLEKSEKSVSIQVEDDGGGVPQEELNKLFRRFHRTAGALPSSAGVGLAITKAIIEKHHGIVMAENGAKGLKVTICIPVIDANEKI